MKPLNPRKEPFVLHREAFDELLMALHPDRHSASEEYERLRARLVRFFDWQGALDSEQLADISLDRLAMKLHRGEQILDLRNYLHGIARMVLREWRSQRQRQETLLDRASRGFSEAAPEPDSEELYQALEQTMAELPLAQRTLMLRYYSAASHAEQVTLRLSMAAEIGISANALRNRMLRLRMELERNTLRKLSRAKKVGDNRPGSHTYW
jgi:DNA-directed RNA polymerase specialized sigma24 family protein